MVARADEGSAVSSASGAAEAGAGADVCVGEADRARFLGAMRLVYTLSAREGKARFGATFRPAIALAAKHNSRMWNFHFGCQFFTSHPAYQLYLEQALRAVDPSISHPYARGGTRARPARAARVLARLRARGAPTARALGTRTRARAARRPRRRRRARAG